MRTRVISTVGWHHFLGRSVGSKTGVDAKSQEHLCDRNKDGHGVINGMAVLELATFERAAGFERFEVFFNDPASGIRIDDAFDVLHGIDGFGGEQFPIDGFESLGSVDFPHMHQMQGEMFRHFLSGGRNGLGLAQRDGRSTELQRGLAILYRPKTASELSGKQLTPEEEENYWSDRVYFERFNAKDGDSVLDFNDHVWVGEKISFTGFSTNLLKVNTNEYSAGNKTYSLEEENGHTYLTDIATGTRIKISKGYRQAAE